MNAHRGNLAGFFLKPWLLATILLSGIFYVCLSGPAHAQGASQCPIPPNPGQCICHNIFGGSGEICPSSNGIVGGHDAHIACFNAGGVGCSVEDKCGKCNGCGDGVLVAGEECDDGNNIGGDGCDPDCKIECSSNAECADTDICTDDVCDSVTHHCTHTNNTAPCDDGNACTENDQCSGGTCAPGTPKSCSDGVECTADSCDSGTGECFHDTSGCECTPEIPTTIAAVCDDNDPCTADACGGDFACHHTPISGNSCDDGIFCDGADTCNNGVCEHAGDPCSGNEFCNNVCDEDQNNCARPEGTTCQDDGNVCTDNQCDGNGDCIAINNNDNCDDTNACTLGDVCDGGTCESGTPKSCDDGIECTVDSCDSGTGECSHDTSGCECTPETATKCDDDDPCTTDSCGEDLTCHHESTTGNSCDDGLFCNGIDTCEDGECQHTGDPCPMGGECNDICNEDTDDCFTPEGVSCQDNDNNVCTDSRCNGNGACVAVNNTADCDDGNQCTESDRCQNGSCIGTPVISVECGTAAGGPVCGNGVVETGEACDDGNKINNDGCDNNCQNSICIEGAAGLAGAKGIPGCGGSTCSLNPNPNAGNSSARAEVAWLMLCLALIPGMLLRGLAKAKVRGT